MISDAIFGGRELIEVVKLFLSTELAGRFVNRIFAVDSSRNSAIGTAHLRLWAISSAERTRLQRNYKSTTGTHSRVLYDFSDRIR
jgi:hypothetical protein